MQNSPPAPAASAISWSSYPYFSILAFRSSSFCVCAICPANRAAVRSFVSRIRDTSFVEKCFTRGFFDSVMTSIAASPPSFMNCFWLSSESDIALSAVQASFSQYASPLWLTLPVPKRPGSHASQKNALGSPLYLPAGHALQVSAFSSAEYFPASHAMQFPSLT